jgi:MarR family transcriptional regulator, 2-MHQ and catechol-resistance regulon repressor
MSSKTQDLKATVDTVLETLPPVWDRIRSNLRSAGTGRLGITLEQFHTLRHIRKGYQSVRSLAEKRQVSPPAVSQAVETLVKKGLVTRRQEGGDRRCVLLELTPYASEILDANYDENRAWMKERMAGLTVAELGELRAAMDILKRTFAPEESAKEG